MMLSKVKEQDGMMLAKVKEQDGIVLAKVKVRGTGRIFEMRGQIIKNSGGLGFSSRKNLKMNC